MTKSRSAAGVALLDNEIFVVGGHDGLQIFNSVSFQAYKILHAFWLMFISHHSSKLNLW